MSAVDTAARLDRSSFVSLTDSSQRLVADVCPSPARRPPPDPDVFRAGELKVFVSIRVPAEAYNPGVSEEDREPMDDMLAMVHYFCAREQGHADVETAAGGAATPVMFTPVMIRSMYTILDRLPKQSPSLS